MPTPSQPPEPSGEPVVPGERNDPHALWEAVLAARAVLAQQRHLPQGPPLVVARAELLHALEAYVGSLTDMGRPIPYALRDELRLQRLTGSPFRPRPTRPSPGRGTP